MNSVLIGDLVSYTYCTFFLGQVIRNIHWFILISASLQDIAKMES